MDEKQHIQEHQYEFPYHHLVTPDAAGFSLSRHVFWGYEYAAYIAFVVGLVQKRGFTKLLDVGCGEGKLLFELARIFPKESLAGVDYSAQSIAFARAFNPGLKFFAENISTTDIGERADIITLIETLEHIPPETLPEFIAGLAKHLTAGGTLILTTPSENVRVNRKHYQHFTREKIETLFGGQFSVESFYYLNTVGIMPAIVQRFLSNRLFILNSPVLKNALYRLYRKHCLHGEFKTTKRVCAVLRKK